MFGFSGLKTFVTRAVGVGSLILKHHGPEIFTYTGIVLGATATVVACVKTPLAVDAIAEGKHDLYRIHDARENHSDVYSEEDSRKDTIAVYTRTAVSVVKVYALPIGLGALSVACILGGHRILRKENAALAAAYTALSESFKKYRQRVTEELGKDKDREYLNGLKKKEVLEQDADGNTVAKQTLVQDKSNISPYAKYFGPTNRNWKRSPEATLMFLRSQQCYANDMLHSRGHIFLNEVYDLLGMDRTEAGQYVGWVDGMGDSFVDFGIYDEKDPDKINFVNGDMQTILLDFNVDGVISDMIEKVFGAPFGKKLIGEGHTPTNRQKSVLAPLPKKG